MNKSIAKTRNELQRITYKINQLKNKYTGETGRPYLNNFENSPIPGPKNESMREMNGENRRREPKEVHENLKQLPTQSNPLPDPQTFKNEIFSYVQKCMLLVKQRQDQLIYMLNNRQKQFVLQFKSVNEQRMKKIEEELTECISNLEEYAENQRKNEKSTEDQLKGLQYNLKREIQKIKDTAQATYEERNKYSQRRIQDFIEVMEELQQEISQLGSWKKETQDTLKVLHDQISNERLQKQNKLQQLIPKLISDVLIVEKEEIQCELQSRIEKKFTDFAYEAIGQIKRLEEKLISQRQRTKDLMKKIEGLQSLIKEDQVNFQNHRSQFQKFQNEVHSKKTLCQFQQRTNIKIGEAKQQVIKLAHHFNEKCLQHLTKRGESLVLEAVEKQKITLEVHIANMIKQSKLKQVSKKSSEIEISDIVDQKLNEFQTDINETIRLLYQDIDTKVTQTIANAGISQLRSEIESIKRQNLSLETTIKSLTLLATEPRQTNDQNRDKSIQSLRLQVYQDMGSQIDKLSQLLQTAIQQMEMKIEKVEHNFSYTYQQMSKIQYDNACFKDQINTLLNVGAKNTKGHQTSNQLNFDNSKRENENELGLYPGLL